MHAELRRKTKNLRTNHDLLRQHNQSLLTRRSTRSSLEPSHPASLSRPTLIQKRTYEDENLTSRPVYDQQLLIQSATLTKLIGSINQLLKENSIMPITRHYMASMVEQLKREMLKSSQLNRHTVSVDDYSQRQMEKQRKIAHLQKQNRQLKQKLEQMTVRPLKQSNSHNIQEDKKLRAIIISQSQVINEQQSVIESHKKSISADMDAYMMMQVQASTIQSLLRRK